MSIGESDVAALTASQRVRLIAEIGRRLGGEDWGLIDLTLRQFGLPWTDNWSGTGRMVYVVEMIDQAPDDTLITLSQHLGHEFESLRPTVEPAFWRRGYFRLFVSHLARFREFAGEIQEDLLPFGVSSFVAHNDIKPTREWQDEIESALATCDAMLALLHPEFHQSNWTDQEIGYAMGRQMLIVTVRLGTDPYGFIGRFQALDGYQKSSANVASELFDVLRQHRLTHRRVGGAVLECFAQSDSFKSAKKTMGLLERLEYWDSSLSTRARLALKTNRQIHGAFGVPERLEGFIGKMERDAASRRR